MLKYVNFKRRQHMGFNNDDADALNQAREFFPIMLVETGDLNHKLTHIQVEREIYSTEATMLLTRAFEAAARFDQDMSLWIEVKTDRFPAQVTQAFSNCTGFGLKAIVTWKGASSHPPGMPLDEEVLEAVRNAQQRGAVWHPIAREPVSAL